MRLSALNEVTVNEYDNNCTLRLDVRQRLVVKLMVPKGARDAWQISRIDYSVLRPAGHHLEGPRAATRN